MEAIFNTPIEEIRYLGGVFKLRDGYFIEPYADPLGLDKFRWKIRHELFVGDQSWYFGAYLSKDQETFLRGLHYE